MLKSVKKSFDQRTVNCNLFGSLLASDFIRKSGNAENEQILMARSLVFIFQAIQRDLNLRHIEVSRTLQSKLMDNFDKVSPDKVFAVSPVLDEVEAKARNG